MALPPICVVVSEPHVHRTASSFNREHVPVQVCKSKCYLQYGKGAPNLKLKSCMAFQSEAVSHCQNGFTHCSQRFLVLSMFESQSSPSKSPSPLIAEVLNIAQSLLLMSVNPSPCATAASSNAFGRSCKKCKVYSMQEPTYSYRYGLSRTQRSAT